MSNHNRATVETEAKAQGPRAAGPEPPGPDRPAGAPKLSRKDPLTRLAFECLAQQLRVVLAHESAAWDGLDPEGVHQMSLGTRRIREALHLFGHVLPQDAAVSLNRDFQWLARALGDVRDLDVCRENFETYAGSIGPECATHLATYQNELSRQWEAARGHLLVALGSQRYAQLLSRFRRFIERGSGPDAGGSNNGPEIHASARKLIKLRRRRVLREGRGISAESPDEALHAFRIPCKRLRYAYEFFGLAYGTRMARSARAVRALQRVLGRHRDACVASERLRAYAEGVAGPGDDELLGVLDHLISGEDRDATRWRGEFDKAWRRFDRKKAQRESG